MIKSIYSRVCSYLSKKKIIIKPFKWKKKKKQKIEGVPNFPFRSQYTLHSKFTEIINPSYDNRQRKILKKKILK